MRCPPLRGFLRIALSLIALAAPAHADEDTPVGEAGRPADKGTFGVGLILGEPTGVDAKIYLSDDRAIQLAVGGAFIASGYQAHGDYVFHPWILQNRDTFVMPLYLGPGVRVIDYTGGINGASHLALGLRAVVGMLFDFKSVPLDVFLEVAGVGQYEFQAGKGFGLGLNVGAGVRYYF
jgi:hypothetical protein